MRLADCLAFACRHFDQRFLSLPVSASRPRHLNLSLLRQAHVVSADRQPGSSCRRWTFPTSNRASSTAISTRAPATSAIPTEAAGHGLRTNAGPSAFRRFPSGPLVVWSLVWAPLCHLSYSNAARGGERKVYYILDLSIRGMRLDILHTGC